MKLSQLLISHRVAAGVTRRTSNPSAQSASPRRRLQLAGSRGESFPSILTAVAATLIALAGVASAQPSLKDAFAGKFLIGAAINQAQFTGEDKRGVPIIQKQFNTITPENVLKWALVHPRPGTNGYDFGPADAYVEFGEKNGMVIIGHTLIWHSQVPRWVFQDEDGKDLTREALLERMRDHIYTVVGRYKGRIKGWDVVNEALQDNGTMRRTPWYRIIGEDYLLKAFQYAQEADPDAELYYNDYSLEMPSKRNGCIELVKKLQSQGAKVTGIGTQQHNKLATPNLVEVEKTIVEFGKLGKVMITELDVDTVQSTQRQLSADVADVARATGGTSTNELSEALQQQQAKRYGDLFSVYMKHADVIDRVTLWGVTDGDSWLNRPGRVNHPLLFDRNGQPKPAFDAVIKAAGEKIVP